MASSLPEPEQKHTNDAGITKSLNPLSTEFIKERTATREGIEELKTIFSLIPDTDDCLTAKQRLALALFVAYRDGITRKAEVAAYREGIIYETEVVLAPDEITADFYLAKALFATPERTSTSYLLALFPLFTRARLAVVRGHRQIHAMWRCYSLPDSFTIASLSYGPEIAAYLFKLVYSSFRSETEEDEQKGVGLFQRFDKHLFWQNFEDKEFRSVLSNAVMWFFVNLPCYLWFSPATSPWGCLFNLIGFAYDIYHDWSYTDCELEKYQTIQNNLQKYPTDLKEAISDPLSKKIAEIKKKKRDVTLIAIGIFIGMFIFYFPVFVPLLSQSFSLIHLSSFADVFSQAHAYLLNHSDIATDIAAGGSFLVVISGLIFGGLGRGLYKLYKSERKPEDIADCIISILSVSMFIGMTFAIPTLGLFSASLLTSALVYSLIAIKQQFFPSNLEEKKPDTQNTSDIFNQLNNNSQEKKLDIDKLKSLDKQKLTALGKQSGFSNSGWVRHMRNWSSDEEKRESSLLVGYHSFFKRTDEQSQRGPRAINGGKASVPIFTQGAKRRRRCALLAPPRNLYTI